MGDADHKDEPRQKKAPSDSFRASSEPSQPPHYPASEPGQGQAACIFLNQSGHHNN